jgi:hypothetical protein
MQFTAKKLFKFTKNITHVDDDNHNVVKYLVQN